MDLHIYTQINQFKTINSMVLSPSYFLRKYSKRNHPLGIFRLKFSLHLQISNPKVYGLNLFHLLLWKLVLQLNLFLTNLDVRCFHLLFTKHYIGSGLLLDRASEGYYYNSLLYLVNKYYSFVQKKILEY